MTVTYSKTINGSRVVIHANANTGTITIAGNSIQSNITSFGSEVVAGASISKITFGAPVDAYWTVKRGANLVGVYNGTGTADYSGGSISIDTSATLSANLVNSTNGYIMIEMKKGA
jgi:hypothetical protein